MNELLAQLYGTGDELEKTAGMELLEKLAEEEGIDLSEFDEDELSALADDVEEEYEAGASESDEDYDDDEDYSDDDDEMTKEAQEKFAEADFLGRVMAHSYVNELNKIAKKAPFLDRMGDILSFKQFRGANKALKSERKEHGKFRKAYDKLKNKGGESYTKSEAGKQGKKLLGAADRREKHLKKERLKGLAKGVGVYAGGAGALGGAGYAAGRHND